MGTFRPFLRPLTALPVNYKFQSDYWEIPVRRLQKEVYWSVVLQILIPEVHDRQTKVIENYLRDITNGDRKYEAEDVIRRLSEYNIFFDKHAYYEDVVMKSIISTCIRYVRALMKAEKYWNDETVLKTFAKILGRRIVLVRYSAPDTPWINGTSLDFNDVQISVYNSESKAKSDIVLFSIKSLGETPPRLALGLPDMIGSKLRSEALNNIFSDALGNKNIERLIGGSAVDGNFLVIMIKKNKKQLEKFLMNSVHVLHMLHHAGVDVAPTKKCDPEPLSLSSANETKNKHGEASHPTSFYFAAEHKNLLYLLYEFSTNSPSRFQSHQGDKSNVWPEAFLSINKELSIVLSETKMLIESSSSQYDQLKYESSLHVTDILEWHKFLTDVREHFVSKKYIDSNGNFVNTDTKFCKQLQTLLHLIKLYKSYFYCGNGPPCTKHCLMVREFKNFGSSRNFYNNLDLSAFILFFDRCFSVQGVSNTLDEVLKTSCKTFLKYICSQKTLLNSFPRKTKDSKKKNRVKKSAIVEITEYSTANVAIHLERYRWFLILDCLEHYLEHSVVQENVTQWLSKDLMVGGIDEIDDHLTLLRLRKYLGMTKEHLHGNVSLHRVAILRIIQVLGESIRIKLNWPPSFLQFLLISCLPKNVSSYVHRICEHLSHLNDQDVTERLELEKHEELFDEMKQVLANIFLFVEEIYELQVFLSREHSIQSVDQCLAEWQKYPNGQHNIECSDSCHRLLKPLPQIKVSKSKKTQPMPRKPPVEETSSSCNTWHGESQSVRECESLFTVIKKQFEGVRNGTNSNIEEVSRKLIHEFRMIFENNFNLIQSLIDENENDYKQIIEYLLLCVEKSLKFLVDKALGRDEELSKFFQKYWKHTVNKEKLATYRAIYESLCKTIPITSDSKTSMNLCFDERNRFLKMIHLLDEHEFKMRVKKEEIFSRVPEIYKKHHEAKEKLLNSVKNKKKFSKTEREELYGYLIFDVEQIKSVKEAYRVRDQNFLKKINDPYGKLLKYLQDEYLNPEDCDLLCEELGINPETKRGHLELAGRKIEKTFNNKKQLEFLLNRMRLLKKLLIGRNLKLNKMWSSISIPKTRICIVHVLTETYRKSPRIQACVEMLLTDCMNVSKGQVKEELQKLHRKMSNFYNGVTLRNLFVYDNDDEFFKIVERSVDPFDLPTEIVSKVVELMSDIETVEMILEMNVEFQCKDLERTLKRYALCDKIRVRQRWEDYVAIISRK